MVLELSGQKLITNTHTDGGRNPHWNQRFRFVSRRPPLLGGLPLPATQHQSCCSMRVICRP